jgi:polysaccharide biosynthesis protein PslF
MSESYGFLSTYPPTQCGLATFTASLATHLAREVEVGIVRVVDRIEPDARPEVVHQWLSGATGSSAVAAAALDQFDLAVVQHEYGIYGGPDGEAVIGLLRALQVPAIVVLHTVLTGPTPHQRAVLEEVVRDAAAVVVMTRTAQRRLLDGYLVDPEKVVVIPHGAPTDWAVTIDDEPAGPPTAGPATVGTATAAIPAAGTAQAGTAQVAEPTILTWGLLGPGKGIEWAIEAVAALQDLDPAPRYLVVGETHPRVLERHGDAYRDQLKAQAAELGIDHRVTFDDRYLDRPSLRRLVAAADVVVLPYDSLDQVTSGVLIEAVTCRRPVVATAFPHAMELLSSGAGTVVAQQDAPALARALREVLSEPGASASMVRAAERLAPDLTWQAVADRYRGLGRRLATRAVPEVA